MVIRGNSCPLGEDQEEQREDRKDDPRLRDFQVTRVETQAEKLGWHCQSHGEYIDNRKRSGINLGQIFQKPSALNFLAFIGVS